MASGEAIFTRLAACRYLLFFVFIVFIKLNTKKRKECQNLFVCADLRQEELLGGICEFNPSFVEFFSYPDIDMLLDIHVFVVIIPDNIVYRFEYETEISE